MKVTKIIEIPDHFTPQCGEHWKKLRKDWEGSDTLVAVFPANSRTDVVVISDHINGWTAGSRHGWNYWMVWGGFSLRGIKRSVLYFLEAPKQPADPKKSIKVLLKTIRKHLKEGGK